MGAAAKPAMDDRLGLFMALSDDLLVRAFWRGTARGPISLHGGGGLTVTPQVDEEEFRSFLLALRPFHAPREPVYLRDLYRDLEPLAPSEEARSALSRLKADWQWAVENGAMQVGLGGKRLKPGDLSRLWLNSRYFHLDLDKRQQLASAPPFTRASMRFAFVGFAIDLGGRVVALREWLLEHRLTAVPARHEFDWDIPAP